MTSAETLLAAWLGLALLKPRPELRPSVGVVPKVLVALAAGVSLAFVPLPDVLVVVLGSIAYFGVLFLLGGIPKEIRHALRRGSAAGDVLPSSSR
jgi:hypothetical protein